MVASVGSISIDLVTNTVKFTNDFRRAAAMVDRESNRMSKSVKGISSVMAGFVGGIAGGAVSAGLGALSGALTKATQAFADFARIGDQAKAAGLGSDFFQALSFGAVKTGVAQGTLNTALETFAENVGKAREGTGQLYSGLLKLNPELLRAVLTAGDQEERLELVAEAMRQTKDAAYQAALANAAFGASGADLIPILENGKVGLDEFMETAREMGLIIPKETIARADELNKKFATLAYTIGIQLQQAIVELAPYIEMGATKFLEFAENAKEWVEWAEKNSFIQALFKTPTENVEDLIHHYFDRPVAEIQAELTQVAKDIHEAVASGLTGPDVDLWFNKMIDRVIALQAELERVLEKEYHVNVVADIVLPETAPIPTPRPGGGGLPNVIYGNKLGQPAIDPAALDKIEQAIDGTTEATRGTTEAVKKAPYITGRYIDEFHRDTAGYFSNLSSDVNTLSASIVRMAEAGLGYTADRGFKFSGIGGSGSWAGRRYTSSTSGSTSDFGDIYGMPVPGAVTDASQITPSGGAQPINVSVIVKPVLEGTRLSTQSTAEIKQAAAAGTNAALRQYYGR